MNFDFLKLAILQILTAMLLALSANFALGGTVSYYHTDNIGSPIAQSDSSGALINTVDYDPYGDFTLENPQGSIGYAGHVYDKNSGLTYMRSRYYDSRVGRFVSVDPKPFSPPNIFTLNRYTYGNNNPYAFTDPDGEFPLPLIMLFFGGASMSLHSDYANAPGPDDATVTMGPIDHGLALALPATNIVAKAYTEVGKESIKQATGIIYLRINPMTGAKYVGQAASPERFLIRQATHNRVLSTQFSYTILGRAVPGKALDVLEESMIRQYGGILKRGGLLLNKRHQMVEARYRAAGGSVPLPY